MNMKMIQDLMAMMNEKIDGKKTYATAIVAILGALATYFSGEATLFQTVMVVMPSVYAMTLRHGNKTDADKTAQVAIVAAELASGKTIQGL